MSGPPRGVAERQLSANCIGALCEPAESNTTVQALKVVVNDTAERGLVLATIFHCETKKSEQRKQKLFQAIQEHRRTFPNVKKRTVLKM